jgi:hypothetical protein
MSEPVDEARPHVLIAAGPGGPEADRPLFAALPFGLEMIGALLRTVGEGPDLRDSDVLSWYVLPKGRAGAFFRARAGQKRSCLLSGTRARDLWAWWPGTLLAGGGFGGAVQRIEVERARLEVDRQARLGWSARPAGEGAPQRELNTRAVEGQALSIWYGNLLLAAPREEQARHFGLLARMDPVYASTFLGAIGERADALVSEEGLLPLLESGSARVRLTAIRALSRSR